MAASYPSIPLMLTRYLAYICFITASCWLLFAGGLLFATIREEPQNAWISTGLMLTVLLPTGCTALYVYRTGFGRPTGTAAQAPRHRLPLNAAENKLQALQRAQQDFFGHLDLNRHLAQGDLRGVGHRLASPGNISVPATYPIVLDYRERQWEQIHLTPPAADEIRVKRDSRAEWEAGNLASFRLLTSWEQEGLVCAVCTPAPKRLAADASLDELAGETYLLLLDPTNGFWKGNVPPAPPASSDHDTSPA